MESFCLTETVAGFQTGFSGLIMLVKLDLDLVVNLVKTRFLDIPLMVYGYSLGGNTLLKWLGEKGNSTGISAAAAVSTPFDLASSTSILEKGFSRIYKGFQAFLTDLLTDLLTDCIENHGIQRISNQNF